MKKLIKWSLRKTLRKKDNDGNYNSGNYSQALYVKLITYSWIKFLKLSHINCELVYSMICISLFNHVYTFILHKK